MKKLVKSIFYNEKRTKKELNSFISRSTQLSFGAECIQFEKKLAAYQGQRECVFFNSGSSANLALIQALLNIGKLKRGDRVGFSAITWPTNVMPLIQLGLVPIPIDAELESLNVSSNTLQEVVSKFTLKALFLTNALGFCADIDRIKEILW